VSQLRQSVFSEQRKESWPKMATSFHTGHVQERGFVEPGLKGLLHSHKRTVLAHRKAASHEHAGPVDCPCLPRREACR